MTPAMTAHCRTLPCMHLHAEREAHKETLATLATLQQQIANQA